MMKEELGGKIMTDFVLLRAKMYAYRKTYKKLEDKHYKGTKKSVVTESHTFDVCTTCFFEVEKLYREKMLFENKKQGGHGKQA